MAGEIGAKGGTQTNDMGVKKEEPVGEGGKNTAKAAKGAGDNWAKEMHVTRDGGELNRAREGKLSQ